MKMEDHKGESESIKFRNKQITLARIKTQMSTHKHFGEQK